MMHPNCFRAWAGNLGLALILAGFVRAEPTPEFHVAPDFFPAPIPSAVPSAPPDAVLARVNGAPILQRDLIREMNARLRAIRQPVPPDQQQALLLQLRGQALDALVARILVLTEADKEKISFSDRRIAQEMARIQSEFPPNLKLEDALRNQGLTEPEFRAEILAQLKIKRYFEAHIPDPVIRDEEALRFYRDHPKEFVRPESVLIRHILLQSPASEAASERKKKRAEAESLIRLLSRGEDFEKLAASRSDDPSRTQGGLIGPFFRGQLTPALEEAAFRLEVGRVGPVVESPAGFHVMRVEQRNPAQTVLFEAAKDRIVEFLTGQKRQDAANGIIGALRKKAVIEVSPAVQ